MPHHAEYIWFCPKCGADNEWGYNEICVECRAPRPISRRKSPVAEAVGQAAESGNVPDVAANCNTGDGKTSG